MVSINTYTESHKDYAIKSLNSGALIFIEKPKIFMRLFISLVVAGALGNILDRIRFGYVNDFIDVGSWPIFNIADSSISIAITIYIVDTLILSRKKDEN